MNNHWKRSFIYIWLYLSAKGTLKMISWSAVLGQKNRRNLNKNATIQTIFALEYELYQRKFTFSPSSYEQSHDISSFS